MRKIIVSLIVSSVLVAACSDRREPAQDAKTAPSDAEEAPPPEPETEPHERERVLRAPQSLVGEYRVAGIDGEALDAAYGIALSITANEIRFENCQLVGWNYDYARGELTTDRIGQPEQASDEAPQRLPCAAPFPPDIAKMVVSIDEAIGARRLPSNAIELWGGGHSLTLFTQ